MVAPNAGGVRREAFPLWTESWARYVRKLSRVFVCDAKLVCWCLHLLVVSPLRTRRDGASRSNLTFKRDAHEYNMSTFVDNKCLHRPSLMEVLDKEFCRVLTAEIRVWLMAMPARFNPKTSEPGLVRVGDLQRKCKLHCGCFIFSLYVLFSTLSVFLSSHVFFCL